MKQVLIAVAEGAALVALLGVIYVYLVVFAG